MEPDEKALKGAKFILSQLTDNEEKNIQFLAFVIHQMNLQIEEQQELIKLHERLRQRRNRGAKNPLRSYSRMNKTPLYESGSSGLNPDRTANNAN